MSNSRKLRRSRQWARYVNHYGHIPSVSVSGWGAGRAIWNGVSGVRWRHVRHQQKRRFADGYRTVRIGGTS